MRVLGIETSGDHGSVAVVQDGYVLSERLFPARMTLCQRLAEHVHEALREAGEPSPAEPLARHATGLPPGGASALATAALDGIAVSLGPGSFTGLRVGIALAKALAHASGLPLVGIPTPEVLAWPLCPQTPLVIGVLQHARKGAVYLTLYRCERGALQELHPTQVLALVEAIPRLEAVGEPVVVAATGQVLPAGMPTNRLRLAPAALSVPRASVVAALATARVPHTDPRSAFDLRPIYALASQAERAHGVDLGMS